MYLYINLFERHHFVPASNEGHENNGINLSSLFFTEDGGDSIGDDSDIIFKSNLLLSNHSTVSTFITCPIILVINTGK